MLCCLFKGQRINSINIMEEGHYAYRKEIKTAGCRRELVCEDCGQPVILKAGQVRQAHFAHFRGFNELCPYGQYASKETDAHRKCKMLLYNLLARDYPLDAIQVEYSAIPSRRSDIYVEFQTGEKLSIDIHSGSISTARWDHKHNDYRNAGITDLWFILGMPYDRKERNMPFFHQIMLNENLNRTAVFIEPGNEAVTLVRNMAYIDKWDGKERSRIFKKEYPVDELIILPDGRLQCDFDALYKEAVKAFVGSNAAVNADVDSWIQLGFDLYREQEEMARDTITENAAMVAEVKSDKPDENKKNAEAYEKYIRMHLEFILNGRNKVSHMDKLASKIVDEEFFKVFLKTVDTMKATNNKAGHEVCLAVMGRAKKLGK